MRQLLFICAAILLLGILELPIWYYFFLRVIVSVTSVIVVIIELRNEGISVWYIIFGFIGIIFNPIIPIYLNNKGIWVVLDVIAAIIFISKAMAVVPKKK
ncbi:MAG: hypothetical protein HQ521_20130 [Bacteroidetes bacterium]|nr:hypothetical protein [Bacteroidota bacterium]